MIDIQEITRTMSQTKDLTLHIEGEEGCESAYIHLRNVSVFRTPSGVSIIFSYED